MKDIMELLNDPPADYRPIPFWSWNDRLDPELLAWQIGEMRHAGLGGYFMHARGGLETEYLGEEWMSCIDRCLREGNERGINSWIYDEAGWPSGFAGGIVTALGEQFHARWLRLERCTAGECVEAMAGLLGVYLLNEEENTFHKVSAAAVDTADYIAGRVLAVVEHSSPYYIDVCDHEAVKAFINATHQRYYHLFGDAFGKGLKGFFTDEPRLFWRNEGDIPWSRKLQEGFLKEHGLDLTEYLPLLFLELNGYEKLRYEYWSMVSRLFVSSYMQQIYQWCQEHNCMLTGHVMMEESIFAQMTGTAGAMPFYEYMHIPGIDWLRRGIGTPVIPRQVSSAARQTGKKFVLTESYALSGWNISFEELKWMAEWQYVNGVNLMCQHLEGYTLRGLRKRDYPPSLFFQQPWWKDYGRFNDYLARLGVLLTSGRDATDVLLLHPMRSGWIAFNGSRNAVIKRLDDEFVWASELLSSLHIDYHYGDETIIGKYGSVKCGRLVIGQCEYGTVVLPYMITMDCNTVGLLKKFLDEGGQVIGIGEFPGLSGGIEDADISNLKDRVLPMRNDIFALNKLLKERCPALISISDGEAEIASIRCRQQELEDSHIYFLVNQDRENSYEAIVSFPGMGVISRYSAEANEIEALEQYVEGNSTICKMKFLPMQSYILLFDKGGKLLPAVSCHKEEIVSCRGLWDVERMDLNTLTLDMCEYSIDGGEWQGPAAVIHLMDILLGMKRSCKIALKFCFDVEMNITLNREFYLVAEKAEEFCIIVNGKPAGQQTCGWWKDTSFRRVDIKPFIIEGKNEIILERTFYQSQKVYDVLFGANVYETEKNKLTYDVELESIYILGDFGVFSRSGYNAGARRALHTGGPFVIKNRPEALVDGDFTQQGLCFFAGNVQLVRTYEFSGNKCTRQILDLGRLDAVMAEITVNGRHVKDLLWRPFTADITEYLLPGENRISVRLSGSNRNLLGPHHHKNGELYNVGPDSFTGKWSWVEREAEGLVATDDERRSDYWMAGYSFVRFGFDILGHEHEACEGGDCD